MELSQFYDPEHWLIVVVTVAHVFFNPIFWNITARLEHRTHFLTKMFGDKYKACYALAVLIFSIGLTRDFIFTQCVTMQPKIRLLHPQFAFLLGGILYLIGSTFVLTSMYKLGVTGTYLGDYFGILMKNKVTSFPFSVLDSPMYTGSTLNFLATAIIKQSPVGIAITVLVFIVYKIAQVFEDSFTNYIYATAAKVKPAKPQGGKPKKK